MTTFRDISGSTYTVGHGARGKFGDIFAGGAVRVQHWPIGLQHGGWRPLIQEFTPAPPVPGTRVTALMGDITVLRPRELALDMAPSLIGAVAEGGHNA